MKSLMSLLQCMLEDSSIWCRASTTRDYKEITGRVEHEGLSFLTITLPSYCSDFEKSLSLGYVGHTLFVSFAKSGSTPLLFKGLIDLVFDRVSGRLLDEPSVWAIFFIRQLTLFCKKIRLPCSNKRERNAFDGFVKSNDDVRQWESGVEELRVEAFRRLANLLFGATYTWADFRVASGECSPKHGPGSTAERISSNRKYDQQSWTERLEVFFSSSDFLIPNYGFYESLAGSDLVNPGAEIPCRVISVPKTLKTPRIIAIEPVCMQYAQQALLRLFVDGIERSDSLSNFIGFTDQKPNQVFARLASQNGEYATLDLSEASDRVSNLLVRTLFEHHPFLGGAVQASRSLRADIPFHGVKSMSRFASMGSATCFPIEAMVFLTIIFHGIQNSLNRSLTRKDILSFSGQVRVYGDDLIVPIEFAQSVMQSLESYGFKVNAHKSFYSGKFRESCGKDYYDGEDVTVTYCRSMLPESRHDASEMISTFSLRNQLYKAGLWKSAEYLDTYLGTFAKVPLVLDTSPVLGRNSFLGYETQKIHSFLHCPLVRGFVVSEVPRPSKLDGVGALMKFFLSRPEKRFDALGYLDVVSSDKDHLKHSGRPLSVDIKTRWASPF